MTLDSDKRVDNRKMSRVGLDQVTTLVRSGYWCILFLSRFENSETMKCQAPEGTDLIVALEMELDCRIDAADVSKRRSGQKVPAQVYFAI
jgi:hypothetical protein